MLTKIPTFQQRNLEIGYIFSWYTPYVWGNDNTTCLPLILACPCVVFSPIIILGHSTYPEHDCSLKSSINYINWKITIEK